MSGKVKVITVGKPKAKWAVQGVEHYRKLLRQQWQLSLAHVKEPRIKSGSTSEHRAAIGELLGGKRDPHEHTFYLSEHGKQWTSPALAEHLGEITARGTHLTFMLAGPFGAEGGIVDTAEELLALGPLTMPHEMALVVLLEQLYRAGTIISGKSYHY